MNHPLAAPSAAVVVVLAAAIAVIAVPTASAQSASAQGKSAQSGTRTSGSVAGPGQEPASAANREIAYGYFGQAQQACREGRWAQAEGFLEISLEFFPQFSESAFLYAKILLRDQRSSHRAVPYLRLALSADNWIETSSLEAVTELAGFYARTRRYAEARRLLESLGQSAAPASLEGRTTAATAWIWARVLAGQGQVLAAESFLRRALERFPQAVDLYGLLSRLLAARGRAGEASEVLRRAGRELPEEPEPVLALAALERTAAGRIELVDRYLGMGGSDAGAALQGLRAGPKDPVKYFEEFLRLGGDRQVLYVDSLQELVQQRLKAGASGRGPYEVIAGRLAESLRRYSGPRTLDADADGLYEELYEYVEGQLRGWTLDADQDGLPEVQAAFSAGLPGRITLHPADQPGSPTRTVELRYSAYPALAEVAFEDAASRRIYSLFPYQLSAAAFASLPVSPEGEGAGDGGSGSPRPLRLRYRGGLPEDETRVRRQSYRMGEYLVGAGGAAWPDRRYHLLEGTVTRLEQAPDGQGNYRHVLHYDRSGPAEGRRDADGDGRYEIREEYSAGRLARVFLDGDGDGIEEFAQALGNGSPRLSWDYNADGRYDSVEYQSSGGETVREFSSRLDGAYDLRAVFRAGRIAQFLRDGRAVPVIYDERRGLFWLGRPLDSSMSLESLRGLSEGVQSRGGRMLFVLRYMGNLYVGELE